MPQHLGGKGELDMKDLIENLIDWTKYFSDETHSPISTLVRFQNFLQHLKINIYVDKCYLTLLLLQHQTAIKSITTANENNSCIKFTVLSTTLKDNLDYHIKSFKVTLSF
jgi:hemerythrin-like domain-containing protein